jgi:hypothetical protein
MHRHGNVGGRRHLIVQGREFIFCAPAAIWPQPGEIAGEGGAQASALTWRKQSHCGEDLRKVVQAAAENTRTLATMTGEALMSTP